MTIQRKNELIAQLVALLGEIIEADSTQEVQEEASNTVEMLTIKECTEVVKGVSESAIRKLIRNEEIPHIRTGNGKRGKILVKKTDLISYFGN